MDPDSWGAADLQKKVRDHSGVSITVRRAPQGDLPKSPSPFDKIILSGSRTAANEEAEWIEKLLIFIRQSLDEKKHVLGVCFGHQALVRALGGLQSVRRADQGEFGWSKIDVIQDSPLFQGLGKSFHSFSSHFDEALNAPKGFKIIAQSRVCPIQAIGSIDAPVFGIQFHPEKDLENAKRALGRMKKHPQKKKFLVAPNESDRLFDEKVGRLIFSNFLKL